MNPRTWLEENGTVYVALMAASWLGVAVLISYTALKIAGLSFEPIDPLYVVALTSTFYILATERSKSKTSGNGA